MTRPSPLVIAAAWDPLRRFTDARIALGRAGHSLPTHAHLQFQLTHAGARDAVHLPLDAHGLTLSLQGLGLQTLHLHSAAVDRSTYLQRPDLGRQLDKASRDVLSGCTVPGNTATHIDLAFVVADGLSALAVHRNAEPLIAAVLAELQAQPGPAWTVAPVAVVEQGRVAVGDEIGQALRARTVVVLIGERPGLSSPDSLGIYLTWEPRVGRTDAQRNCISNVRAGGLAVEAAGAKLCQLLHKSRAMQCTGIALKDDVDEKSLQRAAGNSTNFLTGTQA
jgi:ethanolamine ammonia-lyase small subunit